MRTTKGFILSALISLCLIIISCDNQSQPTSNINGHNNTVSLDPVTDDVELRNKLHALISEITILQIRDGELESIAFFEDIKQLDQPRTFNFDTGHVQIIIRVQRAELDQFLAVQSAIQVEGDVQFTLQERDEFSGADWTRIYMDITNIRSSFSIVLGNVPLIEFVQLDHNLTYDIATETMQHPYMVLNNSNNHSKIILASQEEGQMTFQFSDRIDQVNSMVTPSGASSGEWVGDQQYTVKFSENPLMQVLFDHVYSLEGAYISRKSSFPSLNLRWIPERHWFSYPDHQKIGFSPRDRFYDFLLQSPNPDQYVGLIDTTAAIGDGAGFNYAFYLERKNQEPYLITNGNNSTDESGLWVEDQVFLYWNSEQVIILHTDSLVQEVLFEQSPDLGEISEIFYDRSEQRLMITVLVVDSPGAEKYKLEIWQSTNLSAPVPFDNPTQQFEYPTNDSWFTPKFLIHDRGMLFTGIVDILPITLLIDESKREYEASGRFFMVTGDYAILHEQKNGSEQYVSWNLQKPNKEPIAIAKAPGNIRTFGSSLISVQQVNAQSQEKRYYEYIAAQNIWKPMTFSSDQPYMLYQDVDAIYRSE